LASGALSLYLLVEAFLPPASQPSAKLGVALLHAYQATGSKAMQAAGVHCRYTPTCSHYAEDAITARGTLNGLVMTAGRLWRCSPWGGSGYDPAVETHPAAYVSPQQETEQERRERENKENRDAIHKMMKDGGKEAAAGMALCGATCIIAAISGAVYLGIKIFCMVWAFKDAKARGDQNAILWPLLIFFLTPLIGMVVYLMVRPKGELIPCPSCHQGRLETLTKCPHCSADLASGSAAPPPAPPKT
jgi:putative membrane protein insertion efficiency factor